MMRIGIIDLGTNTFNLLICEFKEGVTTTLYETKIPVKLGEGGINKKIIQPQPFKRGVDAILQFKVLLEKYHTQQVYPLATSAIRNADNGKDFINEIKKTSGYTVVAIDGLREAELIFYGVRKACGLRESKPWLVMDIGGGSTEFIIGNAERILYKQSFEVGAARLLERFNPSEPVKPEEIEQINSYLKTLLQPLLEQAGKTDLQGLTGSSGSFDSFADVIGIKYGHAKEINGKTSYLFNEHEFLDTLQLFIKSNKEERINIPGLVAMRVDMIVVASLLIQFILKELNIHTIQLSTFSLKEGVLDRILSADFN